MKKFFSSNKKLILLLLVFIIAFPIIVLCPSPIGIISKEIGIVIVEYGGAIIGGFLTLYGVWWTIEDNNNNRKKELELQYCPILSADIVEPSSTIYQLSSEIVVLHQHPYFDDADLQYMKSLIKICNVGRGEISYTRLSLNTCRILAAFPNELAQDMNLEDSYILADGVFNFIPINGAFYLCVGLSTLKETFYEQVDDDTYIRMEVGLDISVEGAFSSEKQNYMLHFFINAFPKKSIEEYTYDSLSLIKTEG